MQVIPFSVSAELDQQVFLVAEVSDERIVALNRQEMDVDSS
jgi:hypothetical protein